MANFGRTRSLDESVDVGLLVPIRCPVLPIDAAGVIGAMPDGG